MADTLLSPGVLTRENDISFLKPEPLVVSTAFVGPTVKGPVEEPVRITSYGQYKRIFGETFTSGSLKKEFLTSISVKSFFDQGGETALVTRVVTGSFTAATSTQIIGQTGSITNPFTLQTLGKGAIFNNSTASSDPGTQNSDSSLVSGSADNLRWEITNPNSSKGSFSLVIRRGDDNLKEKIILESFNDLSLDPNSERYVERVIGNQYKTKRTDGSSTILDVIGEYPNKSSYIRVSAVNNPTVDYLGNDGVTVGTDANGISYSGSIPTAQSGSFYNATGTVAIGGANYFGSISGSASNVQGLTSGNYTDVIALLENTDEYKFNVLVTPGLIHNASFSSTIDSFISLVEERKDCIYILDLVGYKDNVSNVTSNSTSLNSSYAATYWPWVQVRSATGKNEYVPASTIIPGVYAFTDRTSEPWFAPAGFLRGGLQNVIQVERKLLKTEKDTLYSNNVNPISTFPGQGIVITGQKTLQKKASALDRVNVRRLLIELKEFIGNQANNLLFEQNTISTRNKFLAAVNPYMTSVIQRQGLYAYRVVMDDQNNSADIVDRNQLVGQIFIQPTKTAEFIILDFTIEPTGASFNV